MGDVAENTAAEKVGGFRSDMPGIAASVALVLVVITLLEFSRRAGVAVPVPFLLLYSTAVIAATVAGIRGGTIAAVLVSAFIVYSAAVGYGPANLTGGMLPVAAGIGLAFFAGVYIGHSRDARLRLIDSLRAREAMLDEARQALALKVEKRSHELAGLTNEFSRLRNLLSSTMRHSPAGVVVVNDERKVESANEAALQMFGLGALDANGVDIDEFLAAREIYIDGERTRGDGYGPLRRAVGVGTVVDGVDMQVIQPDGSERWLRGSFAPIVNDEGGIDGATVVLIDVTDKVNVRLKLEELSRRLLHVQEAERSYIARELHDEIGQHLTGIKLFLHSAARENGGPELLEKSIERVDQLMTTVRNLALEFRPSVLDDLGLAAALRWFIGRQPLPEGCRIAFDADASGDSLSAEQVTAAFRIVQEGITNALRHSGAAAINVRLYNTGDKFCIDVSDDGRGFVHDDAGGEHDTGFGLIFMRERVRELDGTLSIETSPEQGTRIRACFPAEVCA